MLRKTKIIFLISICFLLSNEAIASTIKCQPKAGYSIPFQFKVKNSKYLIEMNGAVYDVKKKKNYVSSDGFKVVYLEGDGIFVTMYPDKRMIVGSLETDKVITAGYCK